jgi:soluble lytic murein transglycosylase
MRVFYLLLIKLHGECMTKFWGAVALVVLTCNLLVSSPASAASQSLERQRRIYESITQQFQRGDSINNSHINALKNYPLYPYVQGMVLSQQLDNWPQADIDEFLTTYDQQVPARKLRVEVLQATVRQKRWRDYLNYYRPEMATIAFRCYWLEALHQTGKVKQALDATPSIWLTGDSFPDACDIPMGRWLRSSQRSDSLILERAILALNNDNKSLASFLIRKLNKPAQAVGEALLRIDDNPKLITRLNPSYYSNKYYGEALVYGLGKLLKIDSERGVKLWETPSFRKHLNKRQLQVSRELVGRQVIAENDALTAINWLKKYDPEGSDAYLLEWRIRLALRLERWNDVSQWIPLLPAPLAGDTTWQYWQARAWQQTGSKTHQADAQKLLTNLAKQRDYYGFLAADLLNQDYSFNEQKLSDSPIKPTAKSADSLARAKEFYALGDTNGARMEWRQSIRDSEGKGLQEIARVANNWDWQNEMMRGAQKNSLEDVLELRFPTPFKTDMQRNAARKGVDIDWLYAIARQESAFMPDAKSPVGAMGLLQLMPTTATVIAKKQGYRLNVNSLRQPATNIDLGSSYLQSLLKTFNDNRILATASYNGGPTRIKRFVLNQTKPVAHDVWIETLPYFETRDYVKRVLSYALIYDYRLNKEKSKRQLFNDNEKLIQLDLSDSENPP